MVRYKKSLKGQFLTGGENNGRLKTGQRKFTDDK